jgi:hypothetical protein
MNLTTRAVVFAIGCFMGTKPGPAQTKMPANSSAGGNAAAAIHSVLPAGGMSRFGLAFKISMLGPGAEVAGRVSHRTNLRGGFNMFTYRGVTFNKDDISYAAKLSLKTVEAHYDFFPRAGGFHVGPGLLAFIGNPVTATASVAGGQPFNLGDQSYISDPTNPVRGSAKFDVNRAAPEVTLGWGNLVSHRERRHLTVPFELGLAFQGAPRSTLNLSGNVCDQNQYSGAITNCRDIANDSKVQSQVIAEQSSLNSKMSSYKEYPILSAGFGFTF